MEDREYFTITEELQRLRDEQQRLRDEQEKLRREKQPSADARDGNSPQKYPEKAEQAQGSESKDSRNGDKTEQAKNADKHDHAEENQPKPPLKQRARTYAQSHPKGIFYGAVGLLAFCMLAVVLILYLRSYESTDDAQVDGHFNAISSRLNGTVTKVHVENNQTVSAGQLLAELDSRDYQTAFDQAKASYASAQAQLQQESPNVPITRTSNQTTISTGQSDVQAAASGVGAAEQEFQSKLAALRQAEANNLKAQTDVERYRPLAQRQEISKQQFDTVLAQAKTQQAAVEAAKASAQAAQSVVEQRRDQLVQANTKLQEANENAPRNVAIRKAGIQVRQAAAQAARAQMEQAELNLSYTKIYAAVAGIVGQKQLEIGQRIEAGQQLLSITQIDDIWITANFKETQLRDMKPGQPVDISVDAFGKKVHGYVESLPGATGSTTSLLPPENATGNYVKVVQRLPVRIRLRQGENPDHVLRPGMSVEPKVWLK